MPVSVFYLFLLTIIFLLAASCGDTPISPTPTETSTSVPIPTIPPTPEACITDYCLEGQRLDADRIPIMAWMWRDGSHWTDGESHEYPNLPLAEGEFIGQNLTCTQSEVILGITAPEEVDDAPMTWIYLPNALDLADEWDIEFVTTLYGPEVGNPLAVARDLDREFKIYCGEQVAKR